MSTERLLARCVLNEGAILNLGSFNMSHFALRDLFVVFAAAAIVVGCASEEQYAGYMGSEKGQPTVYDPVGYTGNLDQLRAQFASKGIHTPNPGPIPAADSPKVLLGQALFFDKIVGGDRNIACSTCHHPLLGTSDALPTSIGVGGSGLGTSRIGGDSVALIPRNSPDLFNRGAAEWETMFWDARVAVAAGYFETPAGEGLPTGLDSLLAAQALFPPTSRHEMRGHEGANELADVQDSDLNGIWKGIMTRVLAIDEYVEMFRAAYPGVDTDDLNIAHFANAIAAYEIAHFTRLETPFDWFLAGDDKALTPQQLRGAELFVGKAGCASCHSGALLTDQLTHSIATPQLGPGKDAESANDFGREHETGDAGDRFAFRTPPLRNVELTGPYMHAGAYDTLEDVIRHHFNPEKSLRGYTGAHLADPHRSTVFQEGNLYDQVLETLSTDLTDCSDMGETEVADLAAFLRALTDPSARDMLDAVPEKVPSGIELF